ncbi:hypothetical protein GGX14DRAFT_301683, partial [Mycena pura]
TVLLKGTYEGRSCVFPIANALHIPTARTNLISGSRLDANGVITQTGKGKITYFNSAGKLFARGEVVNDLYKMDVQIIPKE